MPPNPWLGTLFALVVAASGSASAARVDLLRETSGFLAACSTRVIDFGNPASDWMRISGVYGNEMEADQDFAWTGPRAALRLLVAEDSPTEIRLTLRGAFEGQVVSADWNGVALGEQSVSAGWCQITFAIQPEAVWPGINTVSLRARAIHLPPDRRLLSLCIDKIELLPVGEECETAEVSSLTAAETNHRPLSLASGRAFHLPSLTVPPRGHLVVEAEATAPSNLEIDAVIGALRRDHRLRIDGRQRLELDLADSCCVADAAVTLRNLGPEPIAVHSVELVSDDRSWPWRIACGQLPAYTGLVALTLGLAVFAGRRGLGRAGGRPRVVLDLVLLVALALLVRLQLRDLYPHIDWLRFGDSWEYMMRARALAEGRTSFLGSTYWHQWSTWIRPPGYFAFLALVFGPLGGDGLLAATLQMGLGAGAVVATYALAYPLFGRRAAIVAGALLALSVESAAYALQIMTEPLFVGVLTPGLALLAWVAARRAAHPLVAASAGLLIGSAALIRSGADWYLAVAAIALLFAHGVRRGWRHAVALLAGGAVMVGGWSLRNSMLAGNAMGPHNITTAGFLLAFPDDRHLLVSDLDLATPTGYSRYLGRVKSADADQRMSRRKIVFPGLLHEMRQAREFTARFAHNFQEYFSLYRLSFVEHYLGDRVPCRARAVLDAMNVGYLATLGLAIVGVALTVRDRRVWPLLAWPLLLSAVVPLVFYADPMPGRFRVPIMPVLMAFAGLAVDRALARLERLR